MFLIYETNYHLNIFRLVFPRFFCTQIGIDMTLNNACKVIETQHECRNQPMADQHIEVCL